MVLDLVVELFDTGELAETDCCGRMRLGKGFTEAVVAIVILVGGEKI